MDASERDEILANEFADELKLQDVVDAIQYVYKRLSYHCVWSEIEDHISYLKCVLEEKTKEHEQYQKQYGDWRDKLAVVHSKGEKTFVTAIWDVLFAAEIAFLPPDTSGDSDMRTIINEVLDTADDCGIGARSFPLGYLVFKLEWYCWKYEANPEKVQAALVSIDVPFKRLYAVYKRLNFDDDIEEHEFVLHLNKAFASLVQSFIRKYDALNMDHSDRQSVLDQCIGDVNEMLDDMNENEENYTPRLIQRYEKRQNDLEYL